VVARESDKMKHTRKFMAGLAVAAGAYVLAAGVVALSVPNALAQQHISETAPHVHDHSHGHAHVDAAQAEQLTGRFGAHGDRHPQAPVFETAADGLTERRRRTMSAQSGHFRAISASLLSDAGGEDMLQVHADALAALGGQIEKLFEITSPAPEGETGALAAIWEKPELFAQYTAAYASETARFAQTVREGGDLVNALHDLRYYCVACHAEFRQR
jgi:cytochrome c556